MRYGEKHKTVFLKIILYTYFTAKLRVAQKSHRVLTLLVLTVDSEQKSEFQVVPPVSHYLRRVSGRQIFYRLYTNPPIRQSNV